MKGHVAGALRWRDLPGALWHWLRRGDASAEDFRAAFARSLGLDPAQAGEVRLFGTGRAALHAFTASLELPPGSEVLLPGYTCVVVPNVFMHLGLAVRYVDIARDDFNPTPDAISNEIGPATRVVVVPHNFGLVTEGLDALRAKHPTVVFIEDAAHAWGSTDAIGRMVGTLGHAAFFSFEYSKPLTTGIGGALVIHDPASRERFAAHFSRDSSADVSTEASTHASASAPALHAPTASTVVKQLHTLCWHRLTMSLPRPALQALTALLRTPSRMLGVVAKTPDSEVAGETEPDYRAGLHPLSAAIGLMQASRFDELHALRRAQAQDYDALLTNLPGWEWPVRAPGAVLLRYPLLLPDAVTRDAAIAALEEVGLVGGTWFDDVVHPRGSRRFGYTEGDCPNGERAARTVLNLPLGRHGRLRPSQRAAVRAIAERHGGRAP